MKIAAIRTSRNPSPDELLAERVYSGSAPGVAPARSPYDAPKGLSRTVVKTRRPVGSIPDQFQTNSLVAQIWLIRLKRLTQARFAAAPDERSLQRGYAWQTFFKTFYPLNAIESVRLFENLLRFANYESYPPARAFFLAYAPLAFEHDLSGEYIGPGVWSPRAGPRDAAARVRRTLKRWCDWLEALTHYQVYEQLQAPADQPPLNKAIIFLWPLLKRNNWRYLDLLNALRAYGGHRGLFPWRSERQLANYCATALGLRKSETGKASKAGVPAGYAAAERLFALLPLFQ